MNMYVPPSVLTTPAVVLLILKPLDKDFYNLLRQKETQIPLYAHYKEPMFALLEAIPDHHPILHYDETYFSLIYCST